MAGDYFARRTGGVTGIRIAVRTVRQSRMRASCTPPPTPASAPPSTSLASPTCLSGASGHRSAAGSPRPPAGAGGAADQLVDALVTNLGGLPGSPVPPAPPADAFYTRLGIGDRQATIGWATTLQRLNLVVEDTEPGLADAEQRLLLRVTAGWPDGAGCNVLRSAPPDSPLELPVALDVAVPDGLPLALQLSMTSIERVGSTWKARPLGTIGRTFAAPGYGAGQHVDSDQSFTATYTITPA
jgi:hypothetical protein